MLNSNFPMSIPDLFIWKRPPPPGGGGFQMSNKKWQSEGVMEWNRATTKSKTFSKGDLLTYNIGISTVQLFKFPNRRVFRFYLNNLPLSYLKRRRFKIVVVMICCCNVYVWFQWNNEQTSKLSKFKRQIKRLELSCSTDRFSQLEL